MLAWLLTTDGKVLSVDPPVLRPVIELGLVSDLIDYTTIAPGVDIWRDLLAATDDAPLNAVAMAVADKLVDETTTKLPRVYGNVFLANHDENGEPCGIDEEGLAQLRQHFPSLADKTSHESAGKKVCSRKSENPETPPPN